MNAQCGKKGSCIVSLFLSITLMAGTASAAGQSSANYTVESDVVSAGGGEASSAGYTAEHTTGQPSIGESSSTHYFNYAGFWHTVSGGVAGPDWDGDGVPDSVDNCIYTANPGQEDTNPSEDDNTSLAGIQHYGIACDFDLDNNGAVGGNDFNIFKAAWLSDPSMPNWNVNADFDQNGGIGGNDFNLFKTKWLSSAPW